MTFEQYLSSARRYRVKTGTVNPRYADELLEQLQRHLKTVERWINGEINRRAMTEALLFFGVRYSAKGKRVYRGTKDLIFDGGPASYTKKAKVAEGFAIAAAESGWGGRKPFFVVERVAPARSLDFSKVLKAYAAGKIPRSDEAEVVLFNTPVAERQITEYDVN
jgi:hypothetical protein